MWKVGDKALCIDDRDYPPLNYFPNGTPEKGKEYSVEGFTHRKELGLVIQGLPGYDKEMEPVGYKATRFKKVSLKKKKPDPAKATS